MADCRGEVIMRLSNNFNQGASSVNGDINDTGDPITTHSIMMRDIIPYVNFTSAYMKIDIEGFEHRALVSFLDLLRIVNIQVIQMEWSFLRQHYKLDKLSENRILTEQLVHQLTSQGYMPYNMRVHKLDINKPGTWKDATVIWKIQNAWYAYNLMIIDFHLFLFFITRNMSRYSIPFTKSALKAVSITFFPVSPTLRSLLLQGSVNCQL